MSAMTTSTGESNSVEETQEISLKKWLNDADLDETVYKKLIDADFNSLDLVKEIDPESDDINTLAKEISLTLIEKCKLKKALKKYRENDSNKLVIIQPIERDKIIQLSQIKLKLNNHLKITQTNKKLIDEQFNKNKNKIDKHHEKIIKIILENQKISINTLKDIYNFQINESKKLTNEINNTIKISNDIEIKCNKLLKKPIQLIELEERKKIISKYVNDSINSINKTLNMSNISKDIKISLNSYGYQPVTEF